jgi:hypothetical protein
LVQLVWKERPEDAFYRMLVIYGLAGMMLAAVALGLGVGLAAVAIIVRAFRENRRRPN